MTKWGVLGPGGIAGRFATAMQLVDDGEIVAVASRAQERAEAFADKHGIARRYGSYEQLVVDSDVDAVYVATPHSRHEADTLLALGAGKPVLCEKAFALDAAQARRMVTAAREHGLFLMEAMWSRFLPAYREVRRIIDQGLIGEPLVVEADFGFRLPIDPDHRLFDLGQGGGALLDLGIYPLQLCTFVLGLPEEAAAKGFVGETGADEIVAAVLRHAGGRLGVVKASTRVLLSCTGRISGSEGWIGLPAAMHCPTSLTIGATTERHEVDTSFEGDGLRFQIEEVHRCLAAGSKESPVMPLDESIAHLEVMDSIRAQIGMTYPHEH